MTNLEVSAAEADEREVLERLVQLYEYDFSEILGNDVGPDGLYRHLDVSAYLEDGDKHAYLARVDGRLAGFALISLERARAGTESEVWWVAEFFVMRKYRRQRIGERLATTVFDRHRGLWEVGQVEENEPARAFWRSVIGRYTSSDFDEVPVETGRWQGPVQRFVS